MFLSPICPHLFIYPVVLALLLKQNVQKVLRVMYFMFDSAWYDGLLHQRPMIGTHERSGQHSDHLVLLVVLGHDRLGQHLHLLGNLRQCAFHRIQSVSLLGHLIVHAP